MSGTAERSEPSYVGPPFKDAKVYDAMRVGVVTCRPETSLADVARILVSYDMHSVVVTDLEGKGRPWGIVTTLDLARLGDAVGSHTAGEIASRELVAVDSSESLERAARLMSDRGVSHLIAVQPGTDRPVGVISARGIAAALAYALS